MIRRICALLLLTIVTSFADEHRKKVVAYVPNWIDLKSFAETIPYEKVTHLNIAFENPVNDEGELSFSAKNEALIAKAKEKQVKVLISIGGGAASGDAKLKARYAALLSEKQRPGFVAKLVAYVKQHQFDGLDVDIEGPSITADYGPFIKELAPALKAAGKLCTSALSKGYGGANVPADVIPLFDFINIMAYDGTGPWSPDRPGPHSSLEFAKQQVTWWLERGLKPENAVLGVPFYGYGFGEAFKKRDYPYKTVVETWPGAENKDEVGNTVYYNGLPTIRAKCVVVKEKALGGVMIWSLDGDGAGEKSLLSAIHQELSGEAKPQ